MLNWVSFGDISTAIEAALSSFWQLSKTLGFGLLVTFAIRSPPFLSTTSRIFLLLLLAFLEGSLVTY